jgi:molybdopterin synthase catalytic subunit
MAFQVRVQEEDFDVGALQRVMLEGNTDVGATAVFVGTVRSAADDPVLQLELEHYPGMTERCIGEIVEEARRRWSLLSARVIHRVGALQPGDQIVYVGVTSSHRGDAFQACEFIMDYLKTRAPFWKRETTRAGTHWVEARCSDEQAAGRWQESANS